MAAKIIWIASYPRSGNTWLRFLISNYFFNFEKKFKFDIINKIQKFPTANDLQFVDKNEIQKNPYNLSKYWIEAQQKLKKSEIFCTHNSQPK